MFNQSSNYLIPLSPSHYGSCYLLFLFLKIYFILLLLFKHSCLHSPPTNYLYFSSPFFILFFSFATLCRMTYSPLTRFFIIGQINLILEHLKFSLLLLWSTQPSPRRDFGTTGRSLEGWRRGVVGGGRRKIKAVYTYCFGYKSSPPICKWIKWGPNKFSGLTVTYWVTWSWA